MTRKTHTYRGCNVYPISGRASGVRWESYVDGFGFVYADTLAGIRELIRHYSNGR